MSISSFSVSLPSNASAAADVPKGFDFARRRGDLVNRLREAPDGAEVAPTSVPADVAGVADVLGLQRSAVAP